MSTNSSIPLNLDPLGSDANQATNALTKSLDVSRIYMICVFTVLVWDHLVTFPHEWNWCWRRYEDPALNKINIAKVLFLLNRYYTLFQMTCLVVLWWAPLSRDFCNRIFLFEPFSTTFVLVICHSIFLLRTSAIWGWNKYVMVYLAFLIVAEMVAEFATGAQNVLVPDQTIGCISGSGVSYIWLYWFFPLVYDTSTVLLTAYRVIAYRNKGGGITPLLSQLLRDGVFYFGIVFVVNLLNEIFFLLSNPGLQALQSGLAIVMTSIMAGRLMIQLRGYRNSSPQTFWATSTISHSSQDAPRFSNHRDHSSRFGRSKSSNPNKPGRLPIAANIQLTTVIERHDEDGKIYVSSDEDVDIESGGNSSGNLRSHLEAGMHHVNVGDGKGRVFGDIKDDEM